MRLEIRVKSRELIQDTNFMRKYKKPGQFKREVNNKAMWPGSTDNEKGVIIINKKKSKTFTHKKDERLNKGDNTAINTILHEELHAKRPMLHEATVYKKAREMVKKMSKKQKAKYYEKYDKD